MSDDFSPKNMAKIMFPDDPFIWGQKWSLVNLLDGFVPTPGAWRAYIFILKDALIPAYHVSLRGLRPAEYPRNFDNARVPTLSHMVSDRHLPPGPGRFERVYELLEHKLKKKKREVQAKNNLQALWHAATITYTARTCAKIIDADWFFRGGRG